MENNYQQDDFTLDNEAGSEELKESKVFDEDLNLEDFDETDNEDFWGNGFNHYDFLEAERKILLGAPDLVRPVEDHPIVLVKFGHKQLVWKGHKLKFGDQYPRFYRCNSENCYACKGGARLIDWQIEFFFHKHTKRIVYLAFEKKSKPGSLAAELNGAFAGGFPAVISLQKNGMYNYECKRITPKSEMDLGKEEIRKFLQMLEADEIDFKTIVPEVSNARMLDAEGVGELLMTQGICD